MTTFTQIEGEDRPGPWLIVCDHAGNTVPPEIGGGCLGLAPSDMERHIAYDPGAAGVARRLGADLDAPVILNTLSRLVIDPNRGEDDPTLVMQLSDGVVVPANRTADAAEVARRLETYHRPYHDKLAGLADRRDDTVVASIHSFTPQYRGRRKRPWHIGLLFGPDARLAQTLAQALCDDTPFNDWIEAVSGEALCLGLNQPYGGHLPGDTIDRHALRRGRPNILLELRQDLLTTEEAQAGFADRLAPLMERALQAALA